MRHANFYFQCVSNRDTFPASRLSMQEIFPVHIEMDIIIIIIITVSAGGPMTMFICIWLLPSFVPLSFSLPVSSPIFSLFPLPFSLFPLPLLHLLYLSLSLLFFLPLSFTYSLSLSPPPYSLSLSPPLFSLSFSSPCLLSSLPFTSTLMMICLKEFEGPAQYDKACHLWVLQEKVKRNWTVCLPGT